MLENISNMKRALAQAPGGGALLDLGCADGALTMEFARTAHARSVHGVEVTPADAVAARERGIQVAEADLNRPLPFDDGAFDVVVSNQVIEHLADTDCFVSEIRRLLKPGGLAITSTENLASWHNVAALVLGWQPFSLTNVSLRTPGVGNPLAIHRTAEEPGPSSWEHIRVFAHRGLRELFEAHGFEVGALVGAGYYPLGPRLGRIEPRHAAFLTLVATVPGR
jgi:SAM-dependent methyltransferase